MAIENTVNLLLDYADLEVGELATLPSEVQKPIREFWSIREHARTLDSIGPSIFERIDAYFELVRNQRKDYCSGEDCIPTLTQIGRYLGCDPSMVSRLLDYRHVNGDRYETLLFLAAICPAPLPGQTPRQARLQRLTHADQWVVRYCSSGHSPNPADTASGCRDDIKSPRNPSLLEWLYSNYQIDDEQQLWSDVA